METIENNNTVQNIPSQESMVQPVISTDSLHKRHTVITNCVKIISILILLGVWYMTRGSSWWLLATPPIVVTFGVSHFYLKMKKNEMETGVKHKWYSTFLLVVGGILVTVIGILALAFILGMTWAQTY
jgi:hypothetical protein